MRSREDIKTAVNVLLKNANSKSIDSSSRSLALATADALLWAIGETAATKTGVTFSFLLDAMVADEKHGRERRQQAENN